MLPALDKMRAAGFEVALSAAGGLMIRPIDRLTAAQRQWLKANRAALLAALANERPPDRPPDVVGMVALVGLGQTDSDVHLPAPRPADVVGMVGLVGLGQTDSDVHLPAPRPADVVGMVGLVGLGQTDSDVHLPAPRPADVVGMVDLVGLGQTDSDVHLPAPRPADVVGMVDLVGLGQTDSDVHLPAPRPLLPADESRIRRYLTRIGEADPVTIGELLDVCRRDADARIATLALAIESESQPAPPPPPPKLAARQTPEQRQQCFDARVAEFLRAGMTHEEATAATAKEGW